MASVMDIIVRATDQASEVLERVGEAGGNAAQFIEDNWLKATVALGTAGAAIEGMNRRQADTTAALRRVAVVSGETEGSLRELATGMVDGTDAAADMVRGMERLVRTGVTQRSEFEQILPVMDEFSDATGRDIVESIDIFDRVLSALDIPFTEAEQHLDTLTFLTTQTTVPMMNLGMLMRREAPALREMGLSVDDVAVAMAALEAEGIRGPRAVMAFQMAIRDANGDVGAFWQSLNVSNETLAEQRQRLAEAEGLTAAYAEASNSTITPLEQMQQTVENLMVQYAGLFEALSAVTPILIGIGPISKGVVTAFGLLGQAGLFLSGTVIPAIGGALSFLAANPIVVVIGAIAALVAAFVWLMNNSAEFRDFVSGVFRTVQGVVENVAGAIGGAFRSLAAIVTGIWEGITSSVRGAINFVIGIVNRVIGFLNRIRINVPSIDIPFIGRVGGFSIGLPRIPTIPHLATGAWEILEDMLAVVHRGEMVVPAGTAASIRAAVAAGGGFGPSAPLVHIEHFTGTETESERLALLIARQIGRR